MKLLVDEMPYYKDDCMFATPKWNYEKEIWVSFCKFTDEECDFNTSEMECNFLKAADRKDEAHMNIHGFTDCDFYNDKNCMECDGGEEEPIAEEDGLYKIT